MRIYQATPPQTKKEIKAEIVKEIEFLQVVIKESSARLKRLQAKFGRLSESGSQTRASW